MIGSLGGGNISPDDVDRLHLCDTADEVCTAISAATAKLRESPAGVDPPL